MIRWISIVVLSIGIVGTGVWGYQEHQEKNAVLIQAENTYQRAFHELSYHIDLLHDKIGSSLAMNSKDSLSPQLVEIWRLTSEAHSKVSRHISTNCGDRLSFEFIAKDEPILSCNKSI